MIDAMTYHSLEPHLQHKDKVLEDVEIGRYLKGRGATPLMIDVRQHVAVRMYASFAAAWIGFRKNAFLLTGGTLVSAVVVMTLFLALTAAPFLHPAFLLGLLAIKGLTDRSAGIPIGITLLAPFSFLFAALLIADSTYSYRFGRVTWRNRLVHESR
jgi:hypothetical protein